MALLWLNQCSSKTLSRFSLTNYYAIQILESLDNLAPTQKEINEVEAILKQLSSISSNFIDVSKLVKYCPARGKALLYEENNFFCRAHLILLNNLGFEVTHVQINPTFIKKFSHMKQYASAVVTEEPFNIVQTLRKLTVDNTELLFISDTHEPKLSKNQQKKSSLIPASENSSRFSFKSNR